MHNSTYSYWTLSPYSGYAYGVFGVYSGGGVSDYSAYNELGIRPVVYLKSSARIAGNNGSSATPYILG